MPFAIRRNLLRARLLPWFLWVGTFYLFWFTLMAIGNHWLEAGQHWRIAAAMIGGSYVAGSTPLSGGVVAFPILVLLFGHPAILGRGFSLAIQSIGMVSASIFIISSRQRIAWGMLKCSMLTSALTVPLATIFLTPYISDLLIKTLFAVVWCSFGIMSLLRLGELGNLDGHSNYSSGPERNLALLIGVVGGVVVAITGAGIDMLLYSVLILVSRTDLRVAVPTSVILAAFTSVIGVGTSYLVGNLGSEVYHNWLAAAPVVCLGAPLGAYLLNLIDRRVTLCVVSILCIGQFVWTCFEETLTGLPLALAIGGLIAFQLAFHIMYATGERMKTQDGPVKGSSEATTLNLPSVTPQT